VVIKSIEQPSFDAGTSPRGTTKQSKQPTESFTLIKFTQERPDSQLNFFDELKLYSTCLKFVDYLEDYNLRGGVPPQLYSKILCRKAFYNFIIRKRYFVTKEIVNRYLVPLHQVIALFSFLYPEAYLHQLRQRYPQDIKDIPNFKEIKRIKIYRYLITVQKQNVENAAMIEELRKKVGFGSFETVQEFAQRKKAGKDLHYYKEAGV